MCLRPSFRSPFPCPFARLGTVWAPGVPSSFGPCCPWNLTFLPPKKAAFRGDVFECWSDPRPNLEIWAKEAIWAKSKRDRVWGFVCANVAHFAGRCEVRVHAQPSQLRPVLAVYLCIGGDFLLWRSKESGILLRLLAAGPQGLKIAWTTSSFGLPCVLSLLFTQVTHRPTPVEDTAHLWSPGDFWLQKPFLHPFSRSADSFSHCFPDFSVPPPTLRSSAQMPFSHGSFWWPFQARSTLLTLFSELFTICNYPNLGNRLADVSLNVFIQQIFLSASVVCQEWYCLLGLQGWAK